MIPLFCLGVFIWTMGFIVKMHAIDNDPDNLIDHWFPCLLLAIDATCWPATAVYHLLGRGQDQLMLPPGDIPQ